jgi:hypothetical protein
MVAQIFREKNAVRGKKALEGEKKSTLENKEKEKRFFSNQSRMNLSSIVARDASLYPLKSYKCKPVAW